MANVQIPVCWIAGSLSLLQKFSTSTCTIKNVFFRARIGNNFDFEPEANFSKIYFRTAMPANKTTIAAGRISFGNSKKVKIKKLILRLDEKDQTCFVVKYSK